jgi:hypothetical protein
MRKSVKPTTTVKQTEEPRSLVLLVGEGLSDSRKCANVLGAITLDVLSQRITPQMGNTACNAIGKVMKVKEMEIRYGTSSGYGEPKRLALTD